MLDKRLLEGIKEVIAEYRTEVIDSVAGGLWEYASGQATALAETLVSIGVDTGDCGTPNLQEKIYSLGTKIASLGSGLKGKSDKTTGKKKKYAHVKGLYALKYLIDEAIEELEGMLEIETESP